MKKVNKSALIRELYDKGKSIKEIKDKVKCSPALLAIVLRKHKKKVSEPKRIMINLARRKDGAIIDLNKGGEVISRPDIVNRPAHYTTGGVETLDFIEAKDLNYRLGNVVKYVVRAGKKHTDPVEDLKKARFYLDREINIRERA